MVSFLLIQWGIIGIFAGLFVLIGFFRGTTKSIYHTILTIILTIGLLWLLSFFTVGWFFSPDKFQAFILSFLNFLSDDVKEIISNPDIAPFFIFIADLVIRIVAYFILLPIIHFLLKVLIFNRIYKNTIQASILNKQNEKRAEKARMSNQPYTKLKKPRKSIFNRLLGGAIGGVQGVFLAIILLLPILIIIGAVGTFNSNEQTSTGNNSVIPEEYQVYLDEVSKLNEQGLGAILKGIKITKDKSLDEALFDLAFTFNIKDANNKKHRIQLSTEFNAYLGIAKVVLENGYLDSDFDFNTVGKENLPDLEFIFNRLQSSNLLGYMIPTATRFGIGYLLPDADLYARESSQAGIAAFEAIDWHDEFGQLYNVVAAVFELGSIGELQAMLDQGAFDQFEQEELAKIRVVVDEISKLNLLTVSSVALDYATTLQMVQENISWIEADSIESYLQNRFDFIIGNPYFLKEEIQRLLLVYDALITDEFDANIIDFLADMDQTDVLLTEKYGQWLGNVIKQLSNSQLILKSIPFGIDFGAYTYFNQEDQQELADKLVEILQSDDIKWNDELTNVSNIYQKAVTLGLSQFFGDQANMMELIDNVAKNQLPVIREITHLLLNESDVVNDVLTIASPMIVDTLVTDEELRSIIHLVLDTDFESNEINFNFGQEVSYLLNIVETLYRVTTIAEIQAFNELSTNERVALVNRFGNLTTEQFNLFDQSIINSQILSRVGQEGLTYLDSLVNLGLYSTDGFALNKELSTIFNLGYVSSKFVYQETRNVDFEDVDFSKLLAKDEFKQYLTITPANKHSLFLMSNMAHFAMKYQDNEAIANYLSIPDQLKDMDPDSTEWLTEINHLLSGVLEVGASLGRDNDFALTMFNLTEAMINPTTINLKLPLAYGNKETTDQVFSGFGSSLIVRASAVKLTEQFGASALGFIPGYTITLPDEVIEDGILKAGELESLIHTISLSANDFGEKAGIDTVGALISSQSLNTYLTGFNDLEATTLNAIADNNLIRGLFSDALLAEPVQEYVRSTANGFVANLTLSDNFFSFRREDNKIDQTDFYELLKGVQAAQIQPDVFNDPSNGWINYLNGLLDSQLDQVFGSRIISEIIDFVVTDEGLHLFAADLVDTQYQGIQDQIAFLRNIEINFMDVFSRISEVKGDYDLFDTNEIKILIRSFQALNVNSQQELNSLSQIPNINEKLRETDAFETLFSSVRLHNAVSNIMKDEGPLKAIANAASTAVEDITKVEHEFKWQDFSFKQEKYGLFDYEKVKVLELKLFLIAATRYNWTTMGSPSMLNIQTVITNLYTEDELQTRPIDDIFASKLMIAIFDKALNFENNGLDLAPYAVEVGMKFLEGNATFKDLELSPDILYYDDSVYNANGVLTADSIKDMLRSYTLIDLSGPINFNTIYQTTQNGNFDEIFTSKIIHSLVSNVLSSQELRTFGQTKVNDFQSIFNMPETFLIFEKELRENEAEDGLIKVEELSSLIGSINTLGATTPSSLGSLGVDDVTNMLNRNIVDGEDDFDRFLKSGFIYMTIDKLMQHPNLGTTLGRVITDRLGIEEEAINTTPPVTVIGDVGIEQGRVTKQEMRQSLTSVSLLGLTGRPTQSNLGAELLLDLVDPNNPNDDMSIFLQSDYVYVIMARQFEANYFSQFTKQMVEDIFGEPVSDINMGAPSDSKAVYAGESLITRTELRSLFVSTKLLGLTGVPSADSVSLNTILGLIGQNEDNGEDDLDRFLSSKYVADKFSKLLLSKTVREKIANDRYDYELIVLPESAMDNGRMANKEIYNVLNGLNILGINDFADVDFEIATVINLTDQEVDELLASTYLYVVIDLTMKEEDALDIPNHALVSSGDHLGRIEKAEIKKLIETAQYLDVEDLGSIDADDISLLDLQYIIEEIDSAIINRMISNSMIESLENEGILIPTAAYVDDVERKDLTNDELKKMVDALYHLNGDSYEGNINDILPISSEVLNADLLQNLINVESVLIHRLISHHIIKEDLATPASYAVSGDDYFDSEAPDHDIKVTELELLVEAMHEIGGDLTNVEAETISIEKLEYIYGLNSTIINRVISTAMIDSLTKDGQNNIPSTVYVDSERKDLDYIEMGHLIYSLRDLAGGDESKTIADLFPIDDALLTGTVLDSMVDRESLIIYRIISSSIIDLNLHTDETYAVDGEDNYDEEAINQDIKIDEIKDLVAAVNTIGGNINDVDANNITIAMLQEIVDLDSRILDRIISNTIAESLDQKDVPSYAYRDGRPDLYHEEIEKMVLALERLAGADPNVLISEVLPIADTDLTKELMSDLVETESLIILRVISSGIISADIDTPESILAPDPDSANGGIDIKIAEIEHLIEVMNIFDITNVTTVEDEITIAKLKGLDETELNDILAEPNTIVYFVIDKIVQEALNNHDPLIMIGLIGTNKTTDDFIDNQVRIKREAMAEALAYL